MRARSFQWQDAATTAAEIREWTADASAAVDVAPIEREVRDGGDEALLRLTARFDGEELERDDLRVDPAQCSAALAGLASELRAALELSAANVMAVAEAQLAGSSRVQLPQGQEVIVRDVPVGAAGIYAPGGRAAYPSSVLMCALPARAAGVERVALASPPGSNGRPHSLVLAAAALCEVEEVYAVGGAQAIFALAHGTETITAVDVIAGPGNAWVREAKRAVHGRVGIDNLAGPSELMLVAGPETDPEWAALDLCSQAEHGPDSPLVAVATEERVLEAIAGAVETAARPRSGVEDAPMALVRAPDLAAAVDLANAFAPEHLELLDRGAAEMAESFTTAGCIFTGEYGATAFGDYVAGSNHVLPTGGAGRFSGPLGPGAFRRRIATVGISADAAAALAPQVEALARAEGLPVHGESAMIRCEEAR